ncbi:MAG: hypothetical protein IH898_01930 [Planctomycetes bacterium]|nr:hypothetical protein [Planctomycetota bacterium]
MRFHLTVLVRLLCGFDSDKLVDDERSRVAATAVDRSTLTGKILPKALQLLEKKPDTREEAKQKNLAHAKSLRDRIGHLVE